jgi:hypothetical protein
VHNLVVQPGTNFTPLPPGSLGYHQTLWRCHNERDWNYEATRNAIVGRWEWKFIFCCGESIKPYGSTTEHKGLRIEFRENGTGTVTRKNTKQEFEWDIVVTDNNNFRFQNPIVPQLHGRLLFCDMLMECAAGYFDGADNYFKKY